MRSRQPRKNAPTPRLASAHFLRLRSLPNIFNLTRRRYMRAVAEIWQVSNKRMTALRDIFGADFFCGAELFR
jgi:hypothetical protein